MKALVNKRILADLLLFTAVFAVCLALAFRLTFKDGKAVGTGVFASDRSIYYVYLPATFIYGWDVNKFPHHCDTLYKGFILDYKTGKIVNKMTCGVAILWTPFFLATHAIAKSFDLQPDGFSDFYQHMAVIPPVFFLVLGLFFLTRFLQNYFPRLIVYGSALFILTGTNLYYYGLFEGLMSHVHSFFLFALYLFLIKKFFAKEKPSLPGFALISVVVSMAILVRPTNLIILPWFFLMDATGAKKIGCRIRIFLKPQFLLTFFVLCFLVFLPQLIYWKYVSGSFLHYSYGPEGFFYWKNPVILPLFFSPLNGLFLYNPMVLFFVAGSLLMIIKRKANGLLLLVTFALVAYISGSWHMWFFGGSFGSRPFVEYYALLSLGFGTILTEIVRLRNLFVRYMVVLLLIGFSYYNLLLIHHSCWYTGSVWDWDMYESRLDQAGILNFSKESYTFINDFENDSFEPAVVRTSLLSHSRNFSAMLDNRFEFCGIYSHSMTGILAGNIRNVTAQMWIDPYVSDSTNAFLVASIEDDKHFPWLYKLVPLNSFQTKARRWNEVNMSFAVPLWLNDPGFRLKIYLRNTRKRTFLVDDIRIRFE